MNAISGYSSPAECPEYDNFEVGHTSTSVSLATGLQKARDEAAHEREENSLRTSRCNDDIIGSYVDVEFLIVIYKLLAIAEIALTWRILQDRAVYRIPRRCG